MPRYEFLCEGCGPFEEWRDHRESSAPMCCPACAAAARRVYSISGFSVTSKAGEKARLLNERGGEPRLVERPRAEEPAPQPKPRRVGGRPWQISH